MGKKLVAIITDDHTGADIAEDDATQVIVDARIDGKVTRWDIWLSDKSRDALITTLTKFCEKGGINPVVMDATAEPATRPSSNGIKRNPENDLIRTWHRNLYASMNAQQWSAMNLPVPKDKGQISQQVRDAYYRDNPPANGQQTLDQTDEQ